MTENQQTALLVLTILLAIASFIAGSAISGSGAEIRLRSSAVETDRTAATDTYGQELSRLLTFDPETLSQWLAPEAQSEDGKWLFDLFTPPRIYVHPESGEFIPEPYVSPQKPPLPQPVLVSYTRQEFRYQLAGYVTRAGGSGAICLVEDRMQEQTYRISASGESEIPEGYRPVEFHTEQKQTVNGARSQVGILTLERETGERMRLRSDSRARCQDWQLTVSCLGQEIRLDRKHPVRDVSEYRIEWRNPEAKAPPWFLTVCDLRDERTQSISFEPDLQTPNQEHDL